MKEFSKDDIDIHVLPLNKVLADDCGYTPERYSTFDIDGMRLYKMNGKVYEVAHSGELESSFFPKSVDDESGTFSQPSVAECFFCKREGRRYWTDEVKLVFRPGRSTEFACRKYHKDNWR